MTDDDVAAKVIDIIAEQAMLEPGDVKMDATPDSLGLDSLGLVEIVFAIEESFDISVPYNANDPNTADFDISSVAGIVAGVKRLIAEQA
jgi:acyl carrier protein